MADIPQADVVVVDGRNLLYRAMDTHKTLTTEVDGEEIPTGGAYGFIGSILRVHRKYAKKIIVAWEGKDNFRLKLFPSYKNRDREPTPEEADLRAEMWKQELLLRDILGCIGIRQYEGVGCEADDVMGRLALELAYKRHLNVYLYTNDSDMYAEVRETDGGGLVYVLKPGRQRFEDILITPDKVVERFGVEPDDVSTLKALSGDSSDNIPGVPGVGEKTAAKLLLKYRTLRNIARAASDKRVEDFGASPKVRQAIVEHADKLDLYLQLATIRRHSDIRLIQGRRDMDRLHDTFVKLRFMSFLGPLEIHTLQSMGGGG